MSPFVMTSSALAKKRRMRELFPESMMNLFNDWELRILVLLSLAIQVVLIILGNRRKNISHIWISVVVWTAYLSADAVAIYALGITSREILQIAVEEGSVDKQAELKAFWAPFLLMHLGGQDAITANSLEDNELWLRHGLSLVTQTVATLYVLFLLWSGSDVSLLYIVILICGLIKYGERVGILWAASSEQFRDSTPERQQKISQIVDEQNSKEAEGHVVVPHQVIDLHEVWNSAVDTDWTSKREDASPEVLYKRSQGEILIANRLINIFRPAFTDMLLSKDDSESGKLALKDMNYHSIFNIMSIELGFIYDLLFTKAMVFQTVWGLASRIVILSLTSIALVVFAVFNNNASYEKIDVYITFSLLGVALALELYSLLIHLLSDKVTCWLINHKKLLFILEFINLVQPISKRRRWSGNMGQFNLLSYSLKEKHLFCHEMLGFLGIDENVEKLFYKQSKIVSDKMKEDAVRYVTNISTMYQDLTSFWGANWTGDAQKKKHFESLTWSMELDFDMCILVWHMATHICVRGKGGGPEGEGHNDDENNERISSALSRYMLYLLVAHPFMLPAGIGRVKFHDMHATVTAFFDENRSTGNGMPTDPAKTLKQKCCPKKQKLSRADACDVLLSQVNTRLNLTVSPWDKGKFVLFYGSKLATQLNQIEANLRWLILKETWISMLILAASKCKASHHIQHLKRGGELLTHVWLLLVHFGLTDHFQIPHAREVVELNVQ